MPLMPRMPQIVGYAHGSDVVCRDAACALPQAVTASRAQGNHLFGHPAPRANDGGASARAAKGGAVNA